MKNIIEIKVGDAIIKGETALSRGKTICLMNQIITDLHEIGVEAKATAIPIKEKTVMVFASPKDEFEPTFCSCPESKVEAFVGAVCNNGEAVWYVYTEEQVSQHPIAELLEDFKCRFVIQQAAG